MIKADTYSIKGEKLEAKTTLPEEIFKVKINDKLIAQAVRVYLSNQRTAQAKTKKRSEVKGSRIKIWRQKGTGRARHGDRYAPIFVGGGRAHGPKGDENYKLNLSKRFKKQALFSALSKAFKENDVLVVEGINKIEPKTKNMASFLKKAGIEKKASLILPEIIENTVLSGRNIKNLNFLQAKQLNAYEVLNGGKLVFAKEAVDVIKKHYLKK
jgi:large subunit ribosomal protein L4